MHHLAPESTSTADCDSADDASTRQSSLDSDSSAPQSSSSSISGTHTLSDRPKRSSLKSGLKTSKSAPSLTVRFEVPDLPKMSGVEADEPLLSRKNGSFQSARTEKRASPNAISQAPPRPVLRAKLSKRFSTPAPISRREAKRTSEQPLPLNSRIPSTPTSPMGSRVTSFQSVASAPAILQSTAPSPSQPPSQYNLLQHHIPCIIENCDTNYTTSLFGPTFYSPQQPYRLSRKRALCPWHANQDLKLVNHKAKCVWENMRQNAGRKTLGLIAAEFEIYIQQCREDREWESEELETRQRQRLFGSGQSPVKGKEKVDEGWDWRYTPRPCTMKGCSKQWYSPFDNRLYLFYSTARPSGLLPLTTLCPSCAKTDVEVAEERIEERRCDGGAGPEWKEWCEQVKGDRRMEEEYWSKAQERVVREKGVTMPVSMVKEGSKKGAVVEKRKSDKLKGICVVM
ncbi:hypothetical protein K458DRAFT_382039 [Lentithecium fluviatile CBS 122367]|uniref:Uncharacterized protein n=1 Tax=Lentithecium fluviatile CBS 122367 TaxID=1168545 RepID=A0A6G1JPP8_9PLEO|nr:hypothetical protein K458DRAFT_382039 [Lentithecium fluviatile CBS 122367]